MTTRTDFWDRCIDLGNANGTHLWKCPKRHPDGVREIKTLVSPFAAVEGRDCYWIISTLGATIDRIATTIVDEGTNPTVAPKGKSQ